MPRRKDEPTRVGFQSSPPPPTVRRSSAAVFAWHASSGMVIESKITSKEAPCPAAERRGRRTAARRWQPSPAVVRGAAEMEMEMEMIRARTRSSKG